MTVTVMAAMLPGKEKRHRKKVKEGCSLQIILQCETQELDSVIKMLLRLG